ncbi:MAG TPA: hypothetical protein VMU34_10490 [Mycobacterium sp.]|nr:hypothetical protein [Mycobacterium sp.]
MPQNGAPVGGLADQQEDTQHLLSWDDFPDLPEPDPTPWYGRNAAAAAAGCVGVVGLAALVTAVILVSGDSARPTTVHPGVTASARPTPSASPVPDAVAPPATATQAAPTVPETVATENEPMPAGQVAAPTPVPSPTPTTAPRWWHRLLPHRYPAGQ